MKNIKENIEKMRKAIPHGMSIEEALRYTQQRNERAMRRIIAEHLLNGRG